MEKRFETINPAGLKISGKKNTPDGKGLKPQTPVILLAGFKAFMEMPFIKGLAAGLVERGLAVYRFDPTNGIGESEGDIHDCTVSGYLRDTMAVMDYVSREQGLDLDRLALFGTSMGGLVATLAAGNDSRVKRLITHSAAFDWNILRQHPDITDWREGEWIEFISKSKGFKIRVGFDLFTDGIKYDAFGVLRRLTIPKLFLHSGKDEVIPPAFSERAFREAAEPKELVIIPQTAHTPTTPKELVAIVTEINRFLTTAKGSQDEN